MIPRGRLDIGRQDLAFAVWACLRPGSPRAEARRLERLWSPDGRALATLSVRSGFDLLLRALALPPGSEILVSAVTIRDMVRIVEHHGLVPVPVDLDMEALAPRSGALERASSPRTRAVLVAHLFGSRMPLDPVADFARSRGLLLVEDCAQAFTGPEYRGHPASDVVLFSFGPIKTNTALGGALVDVRDPALRARMRGVQARYPEAGRGWFLARTLKYAAVMAALRPLGLRALAALGRAAGTSHDALVSRSMRGFPGPAFFGRIRRRAPYPLLALLARRLRDFPPKPIRARAAVGEEAARLLPGIDRPGRRAADHTHWVFPVWSRDPDALVRHLWTRGFDATRGASSLAYVPPAPSRPEIVPEKARRAMERTLYLPVHEAARRGRLDTLARAVADHEARVREPPDRETGPGAPPGSREEAGRA